MSDHTCQTINKLNHCCHCGKPWKPPGESSFAALSGWTSLLEALKAWRKAEKQHALMVLGELGGDIDKARDDAERKLHAVRIEADKIEAMSNADISDRR